MKCENCGNEHDGSYGSGRFCSEHCRRSFCGKKRTHFPTKDELKTRNGFLKQRKIGGWQCKECDIWFDTRRELEEHRHLVHPIPKGQPWNKGLTKKSSSTIREATKKRLSNYRNGQFRLGGWKMSVAGREKISNSRRKFIEERGGFSHIGWYKASNLNGVEYTVRGKWELNVANRLNALGIIWEKRIHIPYKTDINRNYFPDFYLPNDGSYVEVKGFYSEADKNKMRAVLQSNPGIKIFFISSNVYEEFISGNIPLDDKLLLNEVSCQNSYGTLS